LEAGYGEPIWDMGSGSTKVRVGRRQTLGCEPGLVSWPPPATSPDAPRARMSRCRAARRLPFEKSDPFYLKAPHPCDWKRYGVRIRCTEPRGTPDGHGSCRAGLKRAASPSLLWRLGERQLYHVVDQRVPEVTASGWAFWSCRTADRRRLRARAATAR
jgi:hypothetical protein